MRVFGAAVSVLNFVIMLAVISGTHWAIVVLIMTSSFLITDSVSSFSEKTAFSGLLLVSSVFCLMGTVSGFVSYLMSGNPTQIGFFYLAAYGGILAVAGNIGAAVESCLKKGA